MSNHAQLTVWHRANALSLALHVAMRRVAPRGAPGLKAQLLRAAQSIPANIAEGAGHATAAQFAHFLTMAIGSANEAETHLLLAIGMGLIPRRRGAELRRELDEVRRMVFGLRAHVQSPRYSVARARPAR